MILDKRTAWQFLLSLIICLAATNQASSQGPGTISFQGLLTNPSGVAIDDTVTVVFTLYDSLDTFVWTETQSNVVVEEGVFTVDLGSDTPFGEIFYQPLKLGIKVGNDSEMTPRTALHSVPYSQSVSCARFDLASCNTGCEDLSTDESNCGSCGVECEIGGMCSGGTCECPVDHTACSGVCADTDTSTDHCGGCDLACGSGESCCTGSCADLTSETSNCGTCGNVCPSQVPACDNAATCQGSQIVSSCTSGVCAGSTDTDVACSPSILASDCGPYSSVFCSGEVDQSAPVCATSCADDFDCDSTAFCYTNTCSVKFAFGSPCLDHNWCLSNNCSGGFCG